MRLESRFSWIASTIFPAILNGSFHAAVVAACVSQEPPMFQLSTEFVSAASRDLRSLCWAALLLRLLQWVGMEKLEIALCRLIDFTCI